MTEPDLPTAIIAFSDIMAVGVLDALQSMGIQVPSQVSVAGYDDQPEAEWTRPKLTPVRQPTEAKGRLAGRSHPRRRPTPPPTTRRDPRRPRFHRPIAYQLTTLTEGSIDRMRA